MADPVEQALEHVTDEVTFVRFLRALAEDFAEDRREAAAEGPSDPTAAGPRGWQNGTVDAFLESAAACAEAHRRHAVVTLNPWRRCAEILLAGKFYE